MFYALDSHIRFHGYIDNPYVLVNTYNAQYELITQRAYSLLLLCDGIFNFDDYELTEEDIALLEIYVETRIINKSTVPLNKPVEIEYQYFNNKFVPAVQWSITPRCNYRCRHCYMDSPVTESVNLSTEECFDIINQMSECGILTVDLTGGEPFVRNDFWSIVEYIVSKNLKIGMIYTNGALLTEKTLDRFEELGVRPGFSLSFDCIGWHDWMRGVPGAEDMAIRALKLVNSRGYYSNVEMCLFKSNLDMVIESIELLRDCGVSQIKIAPVNDSDLWRANSDGNELSTREYCEYVIANMERFFTECRGIEILLASIVNITSDKNSYSIVSDKNGNCDICTKAFLCNSMRHCLYISPEGRICPCISMSSYEDQRIFDKISEHPIKEQLTSGRYINYITSNVSELISRNPECGECSYKYNCYGGCRASALLKSNHDLWGIDEDSCMIYKEGYMERIHVAAKSAWEKANGISN